MRQTISSTARSRATAQPSRKGAPVCDFVVIRGQRLPLPLDLQAEGGGITRAYRLQGHPGGLSIAKIGQVRGAPIAATGMSDTDLKA
jgi:hypothetical protein